MCKDKQTDMLPRSRVVGALVELRQAWEENADGISVIDLHASVGLLLYDVAEMIGLSARERLTVFGEVVSEEIEQELGGTLLVCAK